MINMNNLLIAYDDSVGIVYCPEKGSVKTTTPEHARGLQLVYNDYIDKKLSDQDSCDFEQYLENSFKNKEVLPYISLPNLLEREVLGRLEIMLANDCNLNCKYCYADGGNYGRKPMRMQPEKVVKYLDALLVNKYHDVKVVMLFGGEPTIAPKTIETICEYFSEKVSAKVFLSMPTFTMVTNGTLLDDYLVDLIKRYNIRVTISIDGPKDINDLLRVDRNGNGTFAKIEQSIRLMQRAGCPPQMLEVTYTSLHMRMGYSKETIRTYLREHFGIERVMIANCSQTNTDSSLAYSDYSSIESSEDSHSIPIGLARKFFVDISCDAGLNSCALMPNGELYPCHFFVNSDSFRIATFSDGIFNFGGYSDMLSNMSLAHKCKNPHCIGCWAKALCHSCPAGMLLYNADSSFCNAERERLIKLLIAEAKKCNA